MSDLKLSSIKANKWLYLRNLQAHNNSKVSRNCFASPHKSNYYYIKSVQKSTKILSNHSKEVKSYFQSVFQIAEIGFLDIKINIENFPRQIFQNTKILSNLSKELKSHFQSFFQLQRPDSWRLRLILKIFHVKSKKYKNSVKSQQGIKESLLISLPDWKDRILGY